MTLNEYIEEKYNLSENDGTQAYFKQKQQFVLKRIDAVFNSLESYTEKRGKKSPRLTIVCNTSGAILDSGEIAENTRLRLLYNDDILKIFSIFSFIMENYYLPNKCDESKTSKRNLDMLFTDFIEQASDKTYDLFNACHNTIDELLKNRTLLGARFENYIKMLPDDKLFQKNTIIDLFKKMLVCKNKTTSLFSYYLKINHTDEELRNAINDVYSYIYDFCEQIRNSENEDNLLYSYGFNYFDTDDLFDTAIVMANEYKNISYNTESADFCNQFLSIILAYKSVLLDKRNIFLNDLCEADKKMLDFLLDKFGKESLVVSDEDIHTKTDDEIAKANREIAKLETSILKKMQADKWEEFPLEDREELWRLIEGLSKKIHFEDMPGYAKTDYLPLNKYMLLYDEESIRERLHDIELKLKHPEVYRIFKALKKLYKLYYDINNAEDIEKLFCKKDLKKQEDTLFGIAKMYPHHFSHIETEYDKNDICIRFKRVIKIRLMRDYEKKLLHSRRFKYLSKSKISKSDKYQKSHKN